TVAQILTWADAHYGTHGQWPTQSTGMIMDAPGETWNGVEQALHKSGRGLQGRSSLAKLRAQHRGARNLSDLPTLAEEVILGWADAHRHRTGMWPRASSGPIEGVPGETWGNVAQALVKQLRGL